MPTTGCEPSHRYCPVVSHRHSDEVRESTRPDRNDQSRGGNRDQSIRADALQSRCPSQGRPTKLTTASTSYATHSRKTLQELADKGRINCFLKNGPLFLRKECEPARPEPREEECSTKIVRNLVVDFLVVDVLTASNIILGRPTLHKVKAVIASYLLQLQFEADDGSIGKL
ncbi:hypothetical protein Cgig2_022671 [Carnegiea gigantea]|uniref:Uncharacterized protein n=1 Tax=Carnegiea gigantea TaxID=171969 RepID=A0A9Q1KBP3_9CARY|nr:hypothetical protein Cgig2_022671 [Carnegiea gigantea]